MLGVDNKFLKLILDCYLEQQVHLPTRSNNILDLVLTSVAIKEDICVLPPNSNSDHNILIWSMDCKMNAEIVNKLHCGAKKPRQLWRTITTTQFSRF